MESLGGMYEHGYGVAKDLEKAIYWYCKAAALGDDDAKKDLKRLGVEL
jgi:TPR repeat protein